MFNRETLQTISQAFGPDIAKRNKFGNDLSNYEAGRHILDLCPAFIYDLDNTLISRRNALNCLFSFKSEDLIFSEMKPKHIYALSDIAKDCICKGIDATLRMLDLNNYITTAKIVKAGAAIKKHHADEVFGGRTIRNYITYICNTSQENVNISDNELNICKSIIKEKANELTYTNIKSLPFSLMNYSNRMIVNNGSLVSPDIEAKSNLRKILGDKKYNEAFISKISIKDATFCEDLLIKKIKKITQDEITNIYNNVKNEISEDFIREKLEIASNIKILETITTRGQVKDIVDYFNKNVEAILYAQKNPTVILDKGRKDCIFKVEYCSMQKQIENPREYSEWLTEFGAAKDGNYATFSKICPILKHRCSPYIDGSPITDYDFNIPNPVIESLIMEYKLSTEKDKTAKKILHIIKGEDGEAIED